MIFVDWSWTALLIWSIINALPMWWTIYKSTHIAPNKERDAKYTPWVRHDHSKWSYLLALPLNMLLIPRVILIWPVLYTIYILAKVMNIGWDKSKRWTGWRKEFYRIVA